MVKAHGGPRAATNELTVRPIPTAIARGRFARRPQQDPRLNQLWPLDRWPYAVNGRECRVFVEATAGELNVTVAYSFVDFTDDEWTAVASFPVVIALSARAPCAWFLIEVAGIHFRAPYAIGRGSDAAAIRDAATSPSAKKLLTIYGVQDGVVRVAAVGIMMQEIWPAFAAAVAETPDGLSVRWHGPFGPPSDNWPDARQVSDGLVATGATNDQRPLLPMPPSIEGPVLVYLSFTYV